MINLSFQCLILINEFIFVFGYVDYRISPPTAPMRGWALDKRYHVSSLTLSPKKLKKNVEEKLERKNFRKMSGV